MAYIGLRKPIVGVRKSFGVYEAPYAFGKAIGITVTPNYAEGSLYADDIQAEYDKEFISADTTLNTRDSVFGHKMNENEVVFSADDESNYVGVGWISVEKIDGVRSYTGNFMPKVKYTEPEESYSTKGENIEYNTPSITGKALAEEEDNHWKYCESFKTAQEALDYVYGKFGAALGELAVQSTEGTEVGKTKIAVTPQKTGENTYVYKIGDSLSKPAYNETCTSGYTSWDGTTEIEAGDHF